MSTCPVPHRRSRRPLRPFRLAGVAQLRGRWGTGRSRRSSARLQQCRCTNRSPVVPADDGRIVPTGFAALDAILGPGGLPRTASVAMHGDASSGKTTLALRLAAEAQAGGSIVAYLDLARAFDPVEAVARGVRLEWLVVLTPETPDEGLSIAGALLQGRAVDVLLIDLPASLRVRPPESRAVRRPPGRTRRPPVGRPGSRSGCIGWPRSRVGRAACSSCWSRRTCRTPSCRRSARPRACSLNLPVGRGSASAATSSASGRRWWSPATISGRRGGAQTSGSSTPTAGQRDACLTRDVLLRDRSPAGDPRSRDAAAAVLSFDAPDHSPRMRPHATSPPPLAAPPPPSRPAAPDLRLVDDGRLPERPRRPRRAAVDGRRRSST